MASPRQELGRRAVGSFVWSYLTFVGQKGLVFISMIVVARYLATSEVGVVAFALAVMAYLWRLSDIGMSDALIQRADAKSPVISSTVFWLSSAVGLVLFLATWFGAPYIADLGPASSTVVPVIRALSVTFLLSGVTGVQRGLLKHDLKYREMTGPQVASGFAKGVVGIVLAVVGAGIWSLVAGQIVGAAVIAVGYCLVCRWRPSRAFSVSALPSLLRFGTGMLALGVVAEAIVNVDYIIVGHRLDAASLGLYYFAFRLPDLLISSVSQVGWDVLFPLYARLKDAVSGVAQHEALRDSYLKTMRLGALVVLPAGFGIAALRQPLIDVMLSSKYHDAADAMGLIALYSSFLALSGMSGTVFKALGRTFFMTANAIVYLIVLLPTLWFAAGYGITAVAGGHLVVQLVDTMYLAVVVDRVLAVRPWTMVRVILPGLVAALVMAAAVAGVSHLVRDVLALVIGIPLGALVYLGVLRVCFKGELRLVRDVFAMLRRPRGAVVGAV